MKTKRIGIAGATGYTGIELIRLLWNHPSVNIVCLSSKTYAGKKISDVFPHLLGKCDLVTEEFCTDKTAKAKLDLVFLALPHGLAHEMVPELLKQKIKVIDLGADYRFENLETYEKYYGKHSSPSILKEAVYGLPEFNRGQIKTARLVANPGCYVTAATLALRPLIDKKIIKENTIIIDAKSGVSGAGRKLSLNTHFNEVHDNFSAYNLTKHRHQPEIEQNIRSKVVFSPHLLPIDRGILVTSYGDLLDSVVQSDVLHLFSEYYKKEPFIKVVEHLPSIKEVVGTNNCVLTVRIDKELNKLIVVSVIDNLLKGASGQAVQNMNLMLGFSETQNLESISLYP